MKFSRRIVLWALFVVAMITASLFLRAALWPEMPMTWRKIHRGMSRSEVLAAASGRHYALKGRDDFKVSTVKLETLYAWELSVNYDSSERVASADVRQVSCTLGFMTRSKPKSILVSP